MIKSASIRKLFLTPFALWAIIFVIVPFVVILWYGLTDDADMFSLSSLAIITQPGYFQALMFSLLLALVSTAACLLLAYPMCLILIEKSGNARDLLVTLCALPLLMQSLLLTMALQTILEKNGVLNQFLRLIGLPDVYILNTPTAIVLGMVINFLPYAILPIFIALSKIDQNVIEAARDLGASPWQTFRHVQLPLSLPGAVSAITLVFIPSLTTFFISALLGGNKILLIGNIIEQAFTVGYDFHVGSALSLILMIFVVANMFLTMKFDATEEEA